MALREIIKTFLAFFLFFYIFRTLNDDNLCQTLHVCANLSGLNLFCVITDQSEKNETPLLSILNVRHLLLVQSP